jgi:DNA-binding GntR family transcriptional regulator
MKFARTVVDALTKELREDIITGHYAFGEALRLEKIAARYEVSTMPVRDALRALEAEGLVVVFPHRGASVSEFTEQDLLDIYELRATIERMALRLAVPNMTTDTTDKLATLIEGMDKNLGEIVALVNLNNEFHTNLYVGSNRPHLQELIRNLRCRTQHYLRAYIADLGGMPVAQEEHRTILAACTAKDAELASELVYSHVMEVGHALIDFVRKSNANDDTT